MATIPATTKQLKFLEQLTGKDYSNEELTASEASKRIEKALANKGKEVADAGLEPQPSDRVLPEPQQVIDEAKREVSVEMTKEDWAEKDRKTRKSIERQKALDCAVNFAVAKIQSGTDIKADAVEKVAIIFENYIEFGANKKAT